ncbi:MAG: hypothetical protein WD595_00505 [Waddliaceae bacterium]
MSKIEYTKAEKALSEGLLKLTIENIYEVAELVELKDSIEEKKRVLQKREIAKKLIRVRHDLHWLSSKVRRLYTQMKIKKSRVEEILDKGEEVNKEDVKILVTIADKLQEIRASLPKLSDEEIIEIERKKHINKRFNINDKWLPLK